ncbi:MAG: DUF885 domain-containing protein [Acidobacteriaceae bacterium]|nr:DUF885 domain-containing protein [Acidobacteriaceae bacterium]MBV9297128.1 DUF885 domain-containing protein [Acidobacteriaceae bacterium]
MRLSLLTALLISVSLSAAEAAWVEKSNQNAQVLLNIMARYAPEGAGSLGVSGLDEQISIPSADEPERSRRDIQNAIKTLQERLATESDPLVKQDLEILINAAQRNIRASEAYEHHLLPYDNVGQTIFFGMHSLLDDQIAPERRKASLVRLRRYTGIESGYTPTTVLAEKLWREKLNTPGLLGPSKAEVENDLTTMDSYSSGIGLLLEKYKMTDYQDAYAKLKDQLAEYQQFVRKEVLPKARVDFRLPPELYAINLTNAGVDYTPDELTRLAHQAFTEIQSEMQGVATRVAKERNLPSSDYREVVKALKKEQIKADDVMPLYHDRLAQIEAIIRREHLVTLPDRPCIIRLASAAETAQQPAPHMTPPPLINNHGERGQFVLPGGTTGANGKPLKYDDFTFSAASWTLTAHEARPGHELQFAAMVERGVSEARAIFAFNSTNVEGWGLYSEWFMLPYMPDDGKLISLQLRLLRAARAFLDPELQQGKVTPDQAKQLLENDVVLSEAFATEEVDRFTFRMPGQAVSYFDGYTRLREIRSEAEKAVGAKFDVQKFHDFILSQGLLPPDLLRKAVMTNFVGNS